MRKISNKEKRLHEKFRGECRALMDTVAIAIFGFKFGGQVDILVIKNIY